MEKRVLFRSRWLPWALIAPQLLIIGIFFFWPAGQAVLQSFQMEDAFGMSTEWVGLDNFRQLFSDPTYLNSFKRTALFSVLVAGVGIAATQCCRKNHNHGDPQFGNGPGTGGQGMDSWGQPSIDCRWRGRFVAGR